MQRLPLLNDLEVVIVNHADVVSAWRWLFANVSQCPEVALEDQFIYDQKQWQYRDDDVKALDDDEETSRALGNLYLASQLGDRRSILGLAKSGSGPFEVVGRIGRLDSDVRKVLESKVSFRNGLSEHLAFWVQLADLASVTMDSRFAGCRPNVQPTDKGPDGVFLEIGTSCRVIVQSVKNSIGDPTKLIASASFRDRGDKAHKEKQLDAFWLQVNQELGIVRLSHALEDLCDLLELTYDQRMRYGLLQQCCFNASVVADSSYANQNLFAGFRHIPRDPERRIATFIGSTSWATVAETTRQFILTRLKERGVL